MGIKEFLKPTIWKVVLTIIFLLIFIMILQVFEGCLGGRVCPEGTINYYTLSCEGSCVSKDEVFKLNLINRYPYYFLAIILPYLLSSLIILMYNKIKK